MSENFVALLLAIAQVTLLVAAAVFIVLTNRNLKKLRVLQDRASASSTFDESSPS